MPLRGASWRHLSTKTYVAPQVTSKFVRERLIRVAYHPFRVPSAVWGLSGRTGSSGRANRTGAEIEDSGSHLE